VHPQSIVHSLVEFTDGSLLAQLGCPDMRLPIQIALMHPDKVDAGVPRLAPSQMGTLTFEPPDETRFPALGLARAAWRSGGTAPAVFNAANEAAVARFLAGGVPFGQMHRWVVKALEEISAVPATTLAAVLDADREARDLVARLPLG